MYNKEGRTINIRGNIESLKNSVLEEIEKIYDIKIPGGFLITEDLASKMAVLTEKINREIAVYIDRKGNITDISVGDSSTVSLPFVEGKRSLKRLSGIRCVHTHPSGGGMVSAVDISSMIDLRLDAMIAIGVRDGEADEIYAALPQRDENGEFRESQIFGPFRKDDDEINKLMDYIYEIDKEKTDLLYENEEESERAVLVGLESTSKDKINGMSYGERSLAELEELAITAGAIVLKKILQTRPKKDPAFYVGKGKLEEIALICQALHADLLIFDDELSASQINNIESVVGIKVIDRTSLILDIFAQRARSKEGKYQVELAQLKYRISRLSGLGRQLSRLGGGIGTRGPGEKKLETDRRHIRNRIKYLNSQLEQIESRRNSLRSARSDRDVPVIALVGYTNAGKSTLMNKLCDADVFAENKLFATLDPTTRRLPLEDGKYALLIDTVGFIRKLPHHLIEAFKSTLEEAVYADLLIHVVDVSSEEVEEQVKVVDSILEDLGVLDKPVIMAFNKIDKVSSYTRPGIINKNGKCFEISAVNGDGIEELKKGIKDALPQNEVEVKLFVPYAEGWVISYLHQNGKILSEEHKEQGTEIVAKINKSKTGAIKKYFV
ncbi:GTPase HflX [Acetivibrio saccincola]|mgnify:CR=1 FL=1|uniref:GTPase HflX n=2 Tax=Acetivibrio saccincola TaxID=1677857 RepID=A0A2K9EHW0_9FIRM|nr:GTPase HflX [Acetivibrio saccincola]